MPNPNAFRNSCITLILSNAQIHYGGLVLMPTQTHYEILEPTGGFEYRVMFAWAKNLDNAEAIVDQFMELTGVKS